MTKQIRIENACTSTYKVLVTIQDRVYDTEKNCFSNEWITIKTLRLDQPTFMATEFITSSRRIIVEEVVEGSI